MAVLGDGRVVSASDDDTLKLWDPDSGELLTTFEGHADSVVAVAVTAVAVLDDDRVVSASLDRTVRVWDPSTGELLATFFADARMSCLAASGSMVVASDRFQTAHFLRFEP